MSDLEVWRFGNGTGVNEGDRMCLGPSHVLAGVRLLPETEGQASRIGLCNSAHCSGY